MITEIKRSRSMTVNLTVLILFTFMLSLEGLADMDPRLSLSRLKETISGDKLCPISEMRTNLVVFLRSGLLSSNSETATKALDFFFKEIQRQTNIAQLSEGVSQQRLLVEQIASLSTSSQEMGADLNASIIAYSIGLNWASLSHLIMILPNPGDATLNFNPSGDSESVVLDPINRPEEYQKWKQNEEKLSGISLKGRLRNFQKIDLMRFQTILVKMGIDSDVVSKIHQTCQGGRPLSEVVDELKGLTRVKIDRSKK